MIRTRSARGASRGTTASPHAGDPRSTPSTSSPSTRPTCSLRRTCTPRSPATCASAGSRSWSRSPWPSRRTRQRPLTSLARERGVVLGVNQNSLPPPVLRPPPPARSPRGKIGRVRHVQVTLAVPLRQLEAGDYSQLDVPRSAQHRLRAGPPPLRPAHRAPRPGALDAGVDPLVQGAAPRAGVPRDVVPGGRGGTRNCGGVHGLRRRSPGQHPARDRHRRRARSRPPERPLLERAQDAVAGLLERVPRRMEARRRAPARLAREPREVRAPDARAGPARGRLPGGDARLHPRLPRGRREGRRAPGGRGPSAPASSSGARRP